MSTTMRQRRKRNDWPPKECQPDWDVLLGDDNQDQAGEGQQRLLPLSGRLVPAPSTDERTLDANP